MAVVYGAIGNVSIGGLFLAGIAPGFVVGIGLMIYSHFFGPVGFKKPRASLCDFAAAARASVLPMMIPVIIMGGILTGWFTPTEAGMIASVYILLVVVPLLNPEPHPAFAARLRLYRPALFHSAGAGGGGVRLRLDARLSARTGYRRRLDRDLRRQRRPHHHAPAGTTVHRHRRFYGRRNSAIIIFMPIVIKLNELGNIRPLHMGVVMITTLVFGLITPPYGLSLLVASNSSGWISARRCMRHCRFMSCSSSRSALRCFSRTSCCICRSFCFRNWLAVSRTRPEWAISAHHNLFGMRLDRGAPHLLRIGRALVPITKRSASPRVTSTL